MAITIQIHQHRCMRLGPTVIDDVLDPLSILGLFVPGESIIMCHACEYVFAAIAIDVD